MSSLGPAVPGPGGAARAPHLISTPVVTLAPAGSLPLTALTDLFNAGYSDYLVPLRLDEAAFRDHVTVNDIASQAYLSMVDGADINGIGFGPHTDTHFAIQ